MVKREKKQDICKIGTAAMVFRGEALQTAGGLKKEDLMLNPKSKKVVSIARSRIAAANYNDKKAVLVPKTRRDPAVYDAYVAKREGKRRAVKEAVAAVAQRVFDEQSAARALRDAERDAAVLAKEKQQKEERDAAAAAQAAIVAAEVAQMLKDEEEANAIIAERKKAKKPKKATKPARKKAVKDRERLVELAIDEIQTQGITDPVKIEEVKNVIDRSLEA